MFGRSKRTSVFGPPVPEAIASLLPSGDSKQPWEPLTNGDIIVAGQYALILVNREGVQDSGLWHEVQYVKWSADSHELNVVWVQPDREPLKVTTETQDPKRLMEAITVRVEKTIVATRSFYTPSGVRVSASIRRRADGELFSTLIADGKLTEDDRIKADKIEQTLREELGVED